MLTLGTFDDLSRQVLAITISNKALEADRDRWKQEALVARMSRAAWQAKARRLGDELDRANRDLSLAEGREDDLRRRYSDLERRFEAEIDRASRAGVCISAIASEVQEAWWYERHPRAELIRSLIRDFERQNGQNEDMPDDDFEIPF